MGAREGAPRPRNLVEGTPEFASYIDELTRAQHFALLNREEMMDRVVRQVSEWMGSPGTASYVVEGAGNRLALESSPHGAGRAFSRTAARKQFTVDDLRTAMVWIEYRDTDAFVDEIPAARMDIDLVMADAPELVSVRNTLRRVVNVKGN